MVIATKSWKAAASTLAAAAAATHHAKTATGLGIFIVMSGTRMRQRDPKVRVSHTKPPDYWQLTGSAFRTFFVIARDLGLLQYEGIHSDPFLVLKWHVARCQILCTV